MSTAVTQDEAPVRSEYLPLRLRPSGLAYIDDKRGTWSRSEYVRQALALAARENLTGPHDGSSR